MGKKRRVPSDLTIMKAMEYSGHQFTRGAGCRGGFCGACATIYRTKGSYKLQGALACQKIVEDGMYIAQIPFTPSEKKIYRIENLRPDASTFMEFYPEISRCLSCNTCTKACPQDIMVMDYVQASLRGDVEQVARISFDCLSCGLCAVRCPAEIVPYDVGQLARRLYSKYEVGPTSHVLEKVEQVNEEEFDKKIKELKNSDKDLLKERYENREVILE
jgi:formate hydrogenlyase subunit 6/NADH:ubiquinone oxidoreductase subunit I